MLHVPIDSYVAHLPNNRDDMSRILSSGHMPHKRRPNLSTRCQPNYALWVFAKLQSARRNRLRPSARRHQAEISDPSFISADR